MVAEGFPEPPPSAEAGVAHRDAEIFPDEIPLLELTDEVLASAGLARAVAQVEAERAEGKSIHDMSPQSRIFLAGLGLYTANFVRPPGNHRTYRRRARVARVLGRRAASACEIVSHLPGYAEDALHPDLIPALETVTAVHGEGVHAIPNPHAWGRRKVRNGIVVADAMILSVPTEEAALRLAEPLQLWL